MQSKPDKATDLFVSGFSCAQSVTAAFCEDYGLDSATGLKLAFGLGGGCGLGELCGALTGGVLVVGLKYGQFGLDDDKSKADCRAKRDEFVKEFIEINGSATCCDLLGFDILTTEGAEKYKNLFIDRAKAPCVKFVQEAARILENNA